MQYPFYDRLMLIMNHLKIDSLRGLASKLGITYSKLQSYQRGSSPGIDVLNIILSKIDGLSAEWLLTGNGQMIKPIDIIDEEPATYQNKSEALLSIEEQRKLLDSYQFAQSEIESLKQEVKMKDKQLGDLIKTNLLLLEREKQGGIIHKGVDSECASAG